MTDDLSAWPDDDLARIIIAARGDLRAAQARLDRANAEWTRRHTIGACARDCREPHARDGSYAR